MDRLRRVGLIDRIGVSNYSLEQWRRAEARLGDVIFSNQVRYSIATRAPERAILPWAQEQDRLVIAYSPLAQGLLSGSYATGHLPTERARSHNPLLRPQVFGALAALIEQLRDIAAAHAAAPTQIALAWLLHHPNVVAIPGARTLEQLESNVAAADIDLSPDEFEHLTAASEPLSRQNAEE